LTLAKLMTPDQLIELKSNPVHRAHLVKFIALECFRNSQLEELHTGSLLVLKLATIPRHHDRGLPRQSSFKGLPNGIG
jgi:hypothetical protein